MTAANKITQNTGIPSGFEPIPDHLVRIYVNGFCLSPDGRVVVIETDGLSVQPKNETKWVKVENPCELTEAYFDVDAFRAKKQASAEQRDRKERGLDDERVQWDHEQAEPEGTGVFRDPNGRFYWRFLDGRERSDFAFTSIRLACENAIEEVPEVLADELNIKPWQGVHKWRHASAYGLGNRSNLKDEIATRMEEAPDAIIKDMLDALYVGDYSKFATLIAKEMGK